MCWLAQRHGEGDGEGHFWAPEGGARYRLGLGEGWIGRGPLTSLPGLGRDLRNYQPLFQAKQPYTGLPGFASATKLGIFLYPKEALTASNLHWIQQSLAVWLCQCTANTELGCKFNKLSVMLFFSSCFMP